MEAHTEIERFDKNPSRVTDVFWIYSRDSIFQNHTDKHDGKWMMIFGLNDLDARWNQACNLFRDGRLKGISSIKVSTAKPNPESIFKPGEGIIIFYCGPSEDKYNIMEYGKNILKYMWYPRSHFYFKSDTPSLWSNLRYKHLYYIETGEKDLDLPNSSNLNEQLSTKDSVEKKSESNNLEYFYGLKTVAKSTQTNINSNNSVKTEAKSTFLPNGVNTINDMNNIIMQKNNQLKNVPLGNNYFY